MESTGADSHLKCNTASMEHLGGGWVVEALSWPVVQLAQGAFELPIRQAGEVAALARRMLSTYGVMGSPPAWG